MIEVTNYIPEKIAKFAECEVADINSVYWDSSDSRLVVYFWQEETVFGKTRREVVDISCKDMSLSEYVMG